MTESVATPTDLAPFDELKSILRGGLISPSDEDYDAARTVYNAMIDRRPAAIARCVDVGDVVAAVNFARDHRLPLAVRGGGHNGGGLGVVDDGLVVDLSLLRGTHIDAKEGTVRVGGGCVWGDVDHATHTYGMATPSGIISTTGVGGLTLGGGIGHLSRACGLSIDNLLSVDMVLADGSMVTASAHEHPDLFWAVRGGGNFGVVVSFLFKLHPIKMVYGGPMLWELDRAEEIMRWYRNFITTAPETLNGFFAFLRVPPGPPFPEQLHNRVVCGIVWCYTGPEDKVDEVFAPVREPDPGERRRLPPPAFELMGSFPYPALQGMFDAVYPPGLQWYWRADFVNELSDEAIALHVKHGSALPANSTMHLYPINGAVHRIAPNATAFSFRDTTWAEVIVGVDSDPANASTIKNTYDPTNLFHVNQNIRPTV